MYIYTRQTQNLILETFFRVRVKKNRFVLIFLYHSRIQLNK